VSSLSASDSGVPVVLVRSCQQEVSPVKLHDRVACKVSGFYLSHFKRCAICKECDVEPDNLIADVDVHNMVYNSGTENFKGCRIPVESGLKIAFWRSQLCNYSDSSICDLLEFGFPIGLTESTLLNFEGCKNHQGASDFPSQIADYLSLECKEKCISGPFRSNPFNHNMVLSPLNSVPKRDSSKRRIILNLSWPVSRSVNDFIPKNQYLGEPFELHFPSVDALVELIRIKGPGCLLFKKDLQRA